MKARFQFLDFSLHGVLNIADGPRVRTCEVFSYDSVHPPEPLAIVAASAALALSDIPVVKTVGAVRVGLIDGKYIVNPTVQEMELSRLDMIVAGSAGSIIMIEGRCEFVSEEEMLQAITVGQAAD
ncbi:hypothetical protein L7F22_016861 [Adiantum nelumboides]|nr:hypothetical protein [Adiantum nelumboides]